MRKLGDHWALTAWKKHCDAIDAAFSAHEIVTNCKPSFDDYLKENHPGLWGAKQHKRGTIYAGD